MAKILKTIKAVNKVDFVDKVRNILSEALNISNQEAIEKGREFPMRGKSFWSNKEFIPIGRMMLIDEYKNNLKKQCRNYDKVSSHQNSVGQRKKCLIQ